ncbi:MAG: NTPase [Nitrososphaeria archaeon]
MSKKIFVTGDPGVGKTTLISKVVFELKSKGYIVGGVITRDVRERGVRVGFEILSLNDNVRGVLASTKFRSGPKVGKYFVNLNDLKNIFAASILYAIDFSDIVVCDEVGPMELLSPEVRRAVEALLSCNKPVVGSVHKKMRDPIIERISSSPDIKVYEITFENRNVLPKTIVEEIVSSI